MSPPKILLYLIRRDIRLSDNPVFHEIISNFNAPNCKFTHLLPVYIFTANQIETSGLLSDQNGQSRSRFPQARSSVGGFWRCGHHRAKFLSESVWDLKESLQKIGSDLNIRVGYPDQVVEYLVNGNSKPGTPETGSDSSSSESEMKGQIVEVWMTGEMTSEEKSDEQKIRRVLETRGLSLRLFTDEKYYIHDDDLPYSNIDELPDVFTTFRKSLEPLREKPRNPLPTPKRLPPFPKICLEQIGISIPSSKQSFRDALLKPLLASPDITVIPTLEAGDDLNEFSAHPFEGGETHAINRLKHLLVSGAMDSYHDTRNGLMGTEYSTKLSAYLAHGCITARQIHAAMIKYEDGDCANVEISEDMAEALEMSTRGYGKGENAGTKAVRFELLWRDYMRLCARKFGPKLFSRNGFRDMMNKEWESIDSSSPTETLAKLQRFLSGCTGIGLIDASQRELYLTGYTGNRARQNVANFLAKHLYVDWRLGAEWYESMLVDYDAASNWGNWQYVSGVGNDPREGRIFNPIKQALDYDGKGEYIKRWVPSLRAVPLEDHEGGIDQEKLMGLFQAWRMEETEKKDLGLLDEEWVKSPLTRIQFSVGRRPRPNTRGNNSRGMGHWNSRGGSNQRGPRGRGGYRGGRGRAYAGRNDFSGNNLST